MSALVRMQAGYKLIKIAVSGRMAPGEVPTGWWMVGEDATGSRDAKSSEAFREVRGEFAARKPLRGPDFG
jgi:hypothetical protein